MVTRVHEKSMRIMSDVIEYYVGYYVSSGVTFAFRSPMVSAGRSALLSIGGSAHTTQSCHAFSTIPCPRIYGERKEVRRGVYMYISNRIFSDILNTFLAPTPLTPTAILSPSK